MATLGGISQEGSELKTANNLWYVWDFNDTPIWIPTENAQGYADYNVQVGQFIHDVATVTDQTIYEVLDSLAELQEVLDVETLGNETKEAEPSSPPGPSDLLKNVNPDDVNTYLKNHGANLLDATNPKRTIWEYCRKEVLVPEKSYPDYGDTMMEAFVAIAEAEETSFNTVFEFFTKQ